MTFIDLFRTGLIEYETEDKPVKFDTETLKNIASSTGTINITREHSDEIIGSLSNFIFEDNTLKVEAPNGLDIQGMGLSPLFKCDFRDMGEYLQPINLKLTECGLTESPRTGILYNAKGDDAMSDNLRELLDKKDELVMEQQQEIALLKKQLEETKPLVGQNKELNDKLNALTKQFEDSKAEMEEFKKDAEKLRTQEKEAKESLIKEIAGETDATYLHKLSYDELKDMKERTILTEPSKGQVTSNSEGLDDEGDQEPQEEEIDPYSYEEFDKWDKENSTWQDKY